MPKILHIDTDLQIPNRIHKSATDNKVKQITDKVSGIVFSQTDSAKQPVYNYGGYLNFDGTDDFLSGNKNINLPQSDGITIIIKLRIGSLLAKNLIINHSVALGGWFIQTINGQIVINDGARTFDTGVAFADISLTKIHTFIFQLKPDGTTKSVADNLVGYTRTNNYSGLLSSTGNSIKIGTHSDYPTYTFVGDIYYIQIYNKVLFPEIFNLSEFGYYNSDSFQPFQHYQRYPNDGYNKLFISSKYLKDAVISSADVISSFKSSIPNGSEYLYTLNELHKGKNSFILNKSGNSVANSILTSTPNSYIINTNDFFACGWVKQSASATNIVDIFRHTTGGATNIVLIELYNNTIGLYLKDTLGGVQYVTAAATFPVNEYVHVACSRVGLTLYAFVNGVLKLKSTQSAVLNLISPIDYAFQTGYFTTQTFYIDDILLRIGDSLIDPTGYTVGQKVFEPPIRGGFEPGFKMY